MTSFGAFGNQIGAILGVCQTFLMDHLMTDEFLMTWGWRILFWSGGAIGILGIYLRSMLHETPAFTRLKIHHHLDQETTFQLIRNQKKSILLGICFTALNATTFYLLATYIPNFFAQALGLNETLNMSFSLIILTATTVLLPIFGMLNEKISSKKMLVISATSIILMLFPLYTYVNQLNLVGIAVIGFLSILPITCMTALLVYQITHLFPSRVRYTGVGLSFNLADGILGGFTPVIALLLLEYTGNQGAFCWFILACALVSLVSYFKIKD